VPSSDDRSPAGPGRLVGWAVAASLVVGLSGLLAVRFLQQDPRGALGGAPTQREVEEAAAALDRSESQEGLVTDAAENPAGEGRRATAPPPAEAAAAPADDRTAAHVELRASRKAQPGPGTVASPAPSPEPPAPATAGLARPKAAAELTTPTQEEEPGVRLRQERVRAEALADEESRSGASERDGRLAAAETAPSRHDGAASKASLQNGNEGELGAGTTPLTLEALRWRNHTLLVRGRAAVDGELEIRLLGTGRTETRRVEAGRSFEFGLEDLGDARRLELRLVGWGESWTRDIPSP